MWKLLSLFTIFASAIALPSSRIGAKQHPDVGLDILGLAKNHGYPLELHEIETEDGYILGVHRIPHGRNNTANPNKPAVLLMHGLTSCSADWINIGPGKSLAYLLADLGYDVWMSNARGNAESRQHKTLDPDVDQAEFWSFSWNEIGFYDIPAMIDYILANNNQESLHYVGYSQGTTGFLVMASSKPEYNAKIKLATLLAPAAELTYMKHPLLKYLAPYEEVLMNMLISLEMRELFPRKGQQARSLRTLCDEGSEMQELCKIGLWTIGGYDREQTDGRLLPVFLTNTPAGCNIKQFAHYAQVINAKEFRRWDYHDEQLNIDAYGQAIPPKYDLSKVTAPVSVFYGENDWLTSDTDAKNILKALPNVAKAKLVDYKAWTHIDFIWAIDVVELLYNDVIEVMEQYK